MKTTQQARKNRGFTLIEMVGVLAVIAVLAALLIPRIFAAINESRINNAAVSYNTVKSAAMMYFGKHGRFGKAGGVAFGDGEVPFENWDRLVLLTDQLIEKPFATKLGSGAQVKVVAASAAGGAVSLDDGTYDLDGAADNDSAANQAGAAQYVLEAVITGVALEDAKDLNNRIDGDLPELGPDDNNKDLRGRVKFDCSGGNVSDVYIYIAHK